MATTYASPGVYVEEVASAVQAIAGVSTSVAVFVGIVPDAVDLALPNPFYDPTKKNLNPVAPVAPVSKAATKPPAAGSTDAGAGDGAAASATPKTVPAVDKSLSPFLTTSFSIRAQPGEAHLVTNFTEFKSVFGGFSSDAGHNTLVHAVFGFFNNGGSRCYIVRLTNTAQLEDALTGLEAIEEISIVAAPGLVDPTVQASLVSHCARTKTRFAILDTPEVVDPIDSSMLPADSTNAALYFPWVQIFDPGLKTRDPDGKGLVFMPPSGFMAGIYARVDAQRGVFKAPANEVIFGAVGLRVLLSRAQQDGLNPSGVNCIRHLNGNIRVWGARTIGGDRNHDLKYVPTRRTLNYLSKSIDEGTQWVVFEPNDLSLWAKITRNVTAFLSIMRRNGALFGATDAEAFYVKCDRETNPPELRELGQVVTEIGVAIVRPAEFVIFRLSQWTAPQAS